MQTQVNASMGVCECEYEHCVNGSMGVCEYVGM